MHPINRSRQDQAQNVTLLQEFCHDNERYCKYLRKTAQLFHEILSLIAPLLTKRDTHLRAAIKILVM